MPIRWKVITIDRKSSSVYTNDIWFPRSLIRHYPINCIVKGDPDTPGIMVFHTERQANKLADKHHKHLQVIKVQGIGKGKKVKVVPNLRNTLITDIRKFFKKTVKIGSTVSTWDTPPGTICYKEVEVLT